MSLLLLLDVGGTKTLVAAVEGPVLAERTWTPPERVVRFETPRDPERFLVAVERAAGELSDRARVEAIGVGVPGPLDASSGTIIHSTNLGWRDLPLARLLAERFGVPVRLDDDGNVGALGEAVFGAGRGADPFAFLTLGTGLGAGVIVGGRIVAGAHGSAGELGHLAVGDRDGPRCGCGRRNCVEAWCAGVGLARRAREAWLGGRLPDGSPSPRDASGILRLARAGDPLARRLAERAVHALATGIAAMVISVDPAAISIGGSLAAAEPRYVSRAVRESRRLVHWASGRRFELRAPLLGQDSVLAGAGRLATDALASPGQT
jgi:glucokinase